MSIYRHTTLTPEGLPDKESVPDSYDLSASTHEGKVRDVNEDNFTVNAIVGLEHGTRRSLRGSGMGEPLLCAVFDGTGGATAGVAASRIAAEYATWLYNSYTKSPSDRDRLVNRYVSESSAYIVKKLYNYDGRRGASTFAMAIINRGMLYAYSLGDSRLYLFSGGRLYLVTSDHTVAMDMVREGIYTREQAERSPDSHKLTAFLGIEPASAAKAERYEPIRLKKGDRLLLCTDGLYRMMNDAELSEVLMTDVPDKACALVDIAVARGAKDNVTCAVIECRA
ncbi:MAG: serine/threonine-protein phosphatase [Ruminococcus sp.]|nr:serine/threonine-protein phosphatase [Ruminococcus sp.]